jgi:hypothetical protein
MLFLHQARDALLQKPSLPTRNRRSRGVQQFLDFLIRSTVGKQQHHARSENIARREHPRLRHLLKLSLLIFDQLQWLGTKRACF